MPQSEDPDAESVIGRQGAYAKGVARRQAILDRAIEVFEERGAEGTSLRKIAEALGVSHAALLHYFDSREQLLVAVYEHHERRRMETSGDGSARDAVTNLVVAATANVRVPGFVELYTGLVATSLEAEGTPSREFFTDRFEQVRADAARRIRRDQAAGTVRDDVDADTIAALLVAASDGLQVQWLLDPRIDLETTLGAMSTLLAPPGGAPRAHAADT